MTIKRKEHISETFKGLRAGIVASYARIDGKANELNIMIIDEEHDDKKEYASLTMNEMEVYSCIELLEKMRNEVWGTGPVPGVGWSVLISTLRTLLYHTELSTTLKDETVSLLNEVFHKYGLRLEEIPQRPEGG